MEQAAGTTILRTKLHRPPVANDIVLRDQLLDRLEEGTKLPVTLLSAPAGYGKTTLVSRWLEQSDHKYAWFSIDQTESDLWCFLAYLVETVRGLFPNSLKATTSLMRAEPRVSVSVITSSLLNDMDSLGGGYVVVLDDFHRMWSAEVNEMLDILLEHPPRGLHLVIVSRRDPSIRLRSLRARGMISEIRASDLKLSRDAAADFLQRASARTLSTKLIDQIHYGTEGWPVGLRLAALAIRYAEKDTDFLFPSGRATDVQGYLLDEVLTKLPDDFVKVLCRISILERFNAALCDELLRSETPETLPTGAEVIAALVDAGLFVVALDGQGEWFRFHHLFQELLQQQLLSEESSEAIAELHLNAASWLDSRGHLEEATRHAMVAEAPDRAREFILRSRQALLDSGQWRRLAALLGMLPSTMRASDPELLLLDTYQADFQGKLGEIAPCIQAVERALEAGDRSPHASRDLQPEIDMFNSWVFFRKGQIDEAESAASRAREELDPSLNLQRGNAVFMSSLCLQAQGKFQEARELVHNSMFAMEFNNVSVQERLLMSLMYIDYASGDIDSLLQDARKAVDFAHQNDLPEGYETAVSFLGSALYQRNRLDEAEQVLSELIDKEVFFSSTAQRRSMIILSFILQSQRRTEEALALLDKRSAAVLAVGNAEFIPVLEATRNLLLHRSGQVAAAQRWARSFEASTLIDAEFVFAAGLAQTEILIAQGDEGALDMAEQVLARHLDYYTKSHNVSYLVQTQILLSLLEQSRGHDGAALNHMGQAIGFSRPGRFLRPFADHRTSLVPLLNRLDMDEDGLRYVGEILAAIHPETPPQAPGEEEVNTELASTPAIEVLTKREHQILRLIAEHKSNREIADQLYIAPGTVRRHAENIYQKLGVHKRQDAVHKASGLGIL